MERHSTKMWFRQGISLVCVLLLAGTGAVVLAQTPVAPPPPQPQAQALPPQQLDDLVAPIALYPDPLLGQVLAACTYPVELVEAQQWLQANRNLQGQALTDAARQQNWDASIQAMVAMPDVLAKLNQDIRWATDLGNAFLAQPADVMAAVQRLRARAEQNGRLQSSPQETVTTQDQGGQSAIVIEPANPQIIYVPTYDPAYIWGPPVWGAYPPLYYPYGYGFFPGINIGLFFGGWGGWGFGFGGFGWGWGPNWFGGGLFVNAGFFNHYGYGFAGGFRGGVGTQAWAHNAAHRMGVGYPTSALNSRFGAASQASRIASARSGNYHSFSQGNGAAAGANRGAAMNAYRGSTAGAANGVRSQAAQGASGYQRFQGGRQSYQPPAAQRSQGTAGQQRYSAPSSAQRYSAPSTQHYSAPAATQHYSAPSSSGGGYRSFGGGGGASHSSGGGHSGGGHGRR
jgi:hypothetical protein